MLIEKILIGFVVGTLIGMTGVGGGVLLLREQGGEVVR